jgi:hypothetical protein
MVYLLLPVIESRIADFVAVFVVVFHFLQQQCSGHREAQQQKKFCRLSGRPGRQFSSLSPKGNSRRRRRFDLLLAALPEKVLDQIMDVLENVPEDYPYEMLRRIPCLTRRR